MSERTGLSPMVEMSQAVRETVQRYAPTLRELDSGPLRDFLLILDAFATDLRAEVERRAEGGQS